MIKDSGTRQEFETGAVRDVAEGKGRCDLLPLDIVRGFYNPADPKTHSFFLGLNDYLQNGDYQGLCEAFMALADTGSLETAFLDVAIHFEEGAKKYEERNWEKGIPAHCYVDSAIRHYLKHLRGDDDEPHLRAALWNLLCLMWTHKNLPEMLDLPFTKENTNHE